MNVIKELKALIDRGESHLKFTSKKLEETILEKDRTINLLSGLKRTLKVLEDKKKEG